MLNSGDSELSGQLTTLISSDKEHFISGVQGSSNSVEGGDKSATRTEDKNNIAKGIGVGSKTQYNFSEEGKAEFKKSTGVSNSDFTTVAHEVRHAYDYDQGKMADSNGKGAKDPAEQRAVKNENRARKIENLPARTKYGGEEIDPNKLK